MPVKRKELWDYRRRLLAKLATAAADLQQAAESLPENAWQRRTSGEGVTAHQALACLAELQSGMFAPCIQALLDGNGGEAPVVDCSQWLENGYQPGLVWVQVFDRFHRGWQATISHTVEVEDEIWSREMRHPWFGKRTLQWWLERNLAELEGTNRVLQAAQTVDG